MRHEALPNHVPPVFVPRGSTDIAYQTLFARFDNDGKGDAVRYSWNWSAFLAGPFWYFAKGMNKNGGLWFLSLIVAVIVSGATMFWLPFLLSGVFGNSQYYRFLRYGKDGR